MKTILKMTALLLVLLAQLSCKSQIDISPKTATVVVPAKGELKLFENVTHPSFSLNLKNESTKNSCEAYTVRNGNKKWISPSLLANDELSFSVPKDGSVLLENYSEENISITYTIE